MSKTPDTRDWTREEWAAYAGRLRAQLENTVEQCAKKADVVGKRFRELEKDGGNTFFYPSLVASVIENDIAAEIRKLQPRNKSNQTGGKVIPFRRS